MSAAMGSGAAAAGGGVAGLACAAALGEGVTTGWAGLRPPQAPQSRTRLPSHRTRDARTTGDSLRTALRWGLAPVTRRATLHRGSNGGQSLNLIGTTIAAR